MQYITIEYFKDTNFGDAVNNLIFPYFTRGTFVDAGNRAATDSNTLTILGIGSIMDRASSKCAVCGSGIISPGHSIGKPGSIKWVRGPLTRGLLLKANIPCPEIYGDPTLLLPFIIQPKPAPKTHLIGFIPHYVDKNTPSAKQLASLGLYFIDIRNYRTYQNFVDKVTSCRYIISSSLHGIIVADAYNIPAYRIKLSNNVIGGDFKFRDYYMSVNREYHEISLDSLSAKPPASPRLALTEIIRQCRPYKCSINIRKILQAMPAANEEVKQACLDKLDDGFMGYIHKQT